MQDVDTDLVPEFAGRFPAGTIVGSREFHKIAAANSMIDFFAKKDTTCVDRYFKEPYTNYDTRARDGLQPVREFTHVAAGWDGVHVIVRRVLGEGNLVMLHNCYSNLMGIPGQRVAFDMFEFDDGKIIKHWDALEYAVGADASGLGQIAGSVDIVDRGKEDANRALVTSFLETVVRDGKTELADQFIDTANFVTHSPERAPGLTRHLARFVGAPVSYLRYHMTIAEGNFVFVQGEARIGEHQILVVLDLFRVHAGKIVELWDILEPLPPPDKWNNTNGPF